MHHAGPIPRHRVRDTRCMRVAGTLVRLVQLTVMCPRSRRAVAHEGVPHYAYRPMLGELFDIAAVPVLGCGLHALAPHARQDLTEGGAYWVHIRATVLRSPQAAHCHAASPGRCTPGRADRLGFNVLRPTLQPAGDEVDRIYNL
jgi:hypothetical protein